MYGLIFTILNPRLFQVHSSDSDSARRYVLNLTKLYVLIFAPFLTTAGLLLPLVLESFKIKQQYNADSELIFFGMGMAFLLGLAQLTGKKFEFESKTNVFVSAAFSSVVTMVAAVCILTPLGGLHGAATGTLMGFSVYFLIVAKKSTNWPLKADVFKGVSISVALIAMYRFIVCGVSRDKGILLMAITLTIYTIFAKRSAKVIRED
jgi:O-antigen/teichoic acid export membrane protein